MTNLSTANRQRGAASLLVALVLVMSSTLITLSVAHTHLIETRLSGNERWHRRLLQSAESAWAKSAATLGRHPEQLAWTAADDGALIGRSTPVRSTDGIETRVRYRRADAGDPFVYIRASADSGGADARSVAVSQAVRLLSALSPLAETAPPLVVNGCLSGVGAVDVTPENSDSDAAGDALWQYRELPCPAGAADDFHRGNVVTKSTDQTLWDTYFSVTPDEYIELATAQRYLPPPRRRYWLAQADAGSRPVWDRSLGSAAAPVVLYFPAATGCPRFAAGVRIFGFVFIDAACPEPLADKRVEIIGTLLVNGDINTGPALLSLQHISNADSRQTRLSLPVIRTVRVPGDWRDF
jgi:hypothetical protein